MAVTLEEVAERLAELEQEVARLREMVEKPPGEETPAERGARLLREAASNQAVISAGFAKAFEQMGITETPIGAEKVQEMVAACGIKPEENAFSRGIIEMRDE